MVNTDPPAKIANVFDYNDEIDPEIRIIVKDVNKIMSFVRNYVKDLKNN